MITREIKIVKCSYPEAWYADLIGETMVVYEDRKNFILKEDYDLGHKAPWRHIDFKDCEMGVVLGRLGRL